MPTITISGTVINFPDSGSSPDWSQAVIQFAEAVELALGSVAGAYDVPPQQFVIDAYNPGSGVDIPNLSFATSVVRAAFIKYSIIRTTSLVSEEEAGTLTIVYNPANPIGNKWQIIQERVGDSSIAFSITDTGQFQLTTSTLSGLNHTGVLTYQASALSQ